MRRAGRYGTRMIALALAVAASGCATRGQLERGLAEQRAALEEERAARIAAEQRLSGEVQQVSSRLEGLGTALATLDTEFGTKLTRLEEGLQLAVPVHFAFDQAEVSGNAASILDRFAAIVQRNYPEAMITIEGFTDPAGPSEYNRKLAERRAEAVRQELVARGLVPSQLRTVGYGAERLVVPGAAGQQFGAELNRRVVFVIETGTSNVLGTPTASR